MKGLGGLRPLEMGQSMVQNTAQAIKDDTKKTFQIAKSQVTGQPLKQGNQHMPQPKMTDALGGLGSLLEQNQTNQQNPNPQTFPGQPQQTQSIAEKFAPQQQKDQAALEAARRNLQELEAEMKRIKEEREKNWAEANQQEEQEKKMEELQIEQQQKQQPVRAGSPNPEGGKKKG